MNIFEWGTLILAIWSALSGFIGVIVGAHLTRKSQRDQWMRDNKRQEYRELLTALTEQFGKAVSFFGSIGAQSRDAEMEYDKAQEQTLRIIRDRLFIADFVNRENIMDRWIEATRDIENRGDGGNTLLFSKRFHEIADLITNNALADLGAK